MYAIEDTENSDEKKVTQKQHDILTGFHNNKNTRISKLGRHTSSW